MNTRLPRGTSKVIGVALMIICLPFILTPTTGHTLQGSTPEFKVVATKVCSCASQVQDSAPGTRPFMGLTPHVSSPAYDEQIGLTFTQSFTSLEYNVTAVEQKDPSSGEGPAYLLNGVSNAGYWYQVGVSWNWAPGGNPGTGFDMTYEVFNTSADSIFPSNGQGGVLAFSGPVNAGDNILLDLYFSSAGHNVVMLAQDTDTKATASEAYSNMGATYFAGLAGSIANPNGFFTGLMTEWYHGAPYFTNEAEVIYSNPTYKMTSAWMWMDEFNINTLSPIFSANTSAPVTYSDPTKLQEFSFNGTTEYSDAYEFVTGALNATHPTTSTFPMTLSFKVIGGGVGYSPPTLTYISNGTSIMSQLTESPTTYRVDVGTIWSLSPTLGGSNSTERWQTDQPTSGIANESQTVQLVYYDQVLIIFGFSVSGGGSGFSIPSVTYTSFGSSTTTPVGAGVWADLGSRYQYQNPLTGSTLNERWFAKLGGLISSSRQINATYYHQYLVSFEISFQNTELYPGLPLNATSAGKPYSATLVLGNNSEWLDSDSAYSLPQSYSFATGDRLGTNGTNSGIVVAPLVVSLTYERQFYITISQNTPEGGTLSPPSGWYDSGTELHLDAAVAAGWKFGGWTGAGADSASGPNASLFLTVGPGGPAEEKGVFYPCVTIHVTGSISISYTDGSISGTAPAGTTAEVCVPLFSTLSLSAPSITLLAAFKGWTGAVNSSSTDISLDVYGPSIVTSSSEVSYAGIGILALAAGSVVTVASVVLVRRRGLKGLTPCATTSSNLI